MSHARSNLEDLLRLALADGASLFPALLAVKVLPIVLEPLYFLLHLLGVLLGPFAPFAHLVLELLHHLVERRATMAAKTTMASASAATTASSAASSTLKAFHHLVDELHWIIRWLIRCFLVLLLCGRGILIKHGNHDIWSTTVRPDLKERMLAWETLFAACAVVKVLANGALVADTFDWSHSATVTRDIGVSHLSFLGGLLNWRQIVGLKELLKCLLGLLLQLIVDEVLERLSRDSLDFVALSFLVSLRAALHTIIFHLLIGRGCSSRADLRHVAA